MKTRILSLLLFAMLACAGSSSTPSPDLTPGELSGHDIRQNDLGTDRSGDTLQPPDQGTDSLEKDVLGQDTAGDGVIPVDIIRDTGHDGAVDATDDSGQGEVVVSDTTFVDSVPGNRSQLFRLTSLKDQKPGFVYCQASGGCTNITNMVNQVINNYIRGKSGADQVDILVEFARNDQEYTATVGNGHCTRQQNRITGCTFSSGEKLARYQDVVFKGSAISSQCLNDPQVIPTCFATGKQDASIAIPGMQIVVGLKDASIAAHFDQDDPFHSSTMKGYLIGFMPFQWAQSIVIDYPGYFHDSMDKLLPRDKIDEYKGEKGWWFTFQFDAKPVPYSP